jgi:hypothetical protein
MIAGLTGPRRSSGRLEEMEKSAFIPGGLEHDPVITLGIRGKKDVDLLVNLKQALRERGFSIRQFNAADKRRFTCLDSWSFIRFAIFENWLGARDYVCVIEKATGSWLTSLGVQWQRSEV